MRNGTKDLVNVSEKAVVTIREVCKVRPHMSNGILKRKMAAAVAEELRNPKPNYPPMARGHHDFIAILRPSPLVEMERDAYLVVKKNVEFPDQSVWVIPTVLSKEDYEARVQEYREGTSLHTLEDNQVLTAAIQAIPTHDDLLRKYPLVVLRTDNGLSKGFESKAEAGKYVNELLENGADASFVRVFELKPLKVQVSF